MNDTSGRTLNDVYPAPEKPFCILDSNLRIKQISRSFLDIFHVNRSAVLHTRITDTMLLGSMQPDLVQAVQNILEGSADQETVTVSSEDAAGTSRMYQILLSPEKAKKGHHYGTVQGVMLELTDITTTPSLQDQISRYHSLVTIIHEISIFRQENPPPGRLVQYLMSRVGPVIHPLYLSFIDIGYEHEDPHNFNEVFLWSRRYGFIVGEGLGRIPDGEGTFESYQNDHRQLHPSVYSRETAPAILRDLMERREVSTALLIPIRSMEKLFGCLILWNIGPCWSETDITSLQILADIVGSLINKNRIEGELIRSEEKFKAVVEDIGDIYYLTDKAGLLLEISPSMVTVLGYQSEDEIIGKSLEHFLVNQDLWPVFLSDVLNENGVKDYELVLRGAEQKTITGSVSCRLIYDEGGDLRGIEGIIRDISRRKQYEQLVQESEWKYEQARKIAKLGVWSYDMESYSFRVSPEVFSILATPVGKNTLTLNDLIAAAAPDDKAKFSQYFKQVVSTGNEFGFESRIQLSDEKFKYIKLNGQPRIRDGVVTGSFGILQDITERKEVEQHLLRYANQLEQKTLEMDAMRTQLLDMNRELDLRVRRRTTQIEELLRQKDEFIMQIGHDLKTPLTPLVALLPFIRSKETDPELQELLDISITDVKSIKKMITTILELAQMNSLYTLSDLQHVNLHEALERIISDNAYLIHQKSLVVRNHIPDTITVMISPMHLETVMGNLIGNAVKYSYIDGEIILSAGEQTDSVMITVKDSGIGIDPAVISRIFDEFYKADSSRHDRESHGLGLSIAQRIADIYGGYIKAESEGVGKGSIFTLKLKKTPPVRSLQTGKE